MEFKTIPISIAMECLHELMKENIDFAWKQHMKMVEYLQEHREYDLQYAHITVGLLMNYLFGIDTIPMIKSRAVVKENKCCHIWSDVKKNTIQSCIICGAIRGDEDEYR